MIPFGKNTAPPGISRRSCGLSPAIPGSYPASVTHGEAVKVLFGLKTLELATFLARTWKKKSIPVRTVVGV
jgi:hypothetical protein